MIDWQAMYRSKLVSVEDAAATIKSGDLVCSSAVNGQPVALTNAMVKRMKEGTLQGVNYISALECRFLDMYQPENMQKISEKQNIEIK